jgi:cell division cycle 14
MTYKFCYQLNKLLQDTKYLDYCIYHYCGIGPSKKANAAYLMCAFQVVILKRSPLEAWSRFKSLDLLSFRDASYGPCFYDCSILDCLRGLEKAIELRWFTLQAFDLKNYETKEKVENGDMNWIIPNKLLAFSSPNDNSPNSDLYQIFTVQEYCKAFETEKIRTVIRLNNRTYDEKQFTESEIKHHDLYFPDGSCPSQEIIEKFIQIVENEPSAIAVHCKAGLGRTGTLIGCYAIKKFKFPARDFIAWCRICRPGSILGPQQQFLIEFEKKVWGNEDFVNYSAWDRFKAIYGDQGQGQRLIKAKRSFNTVEDGERENGFLHRTPLVRSRSIYADIN